MIVLEKECSQTYSSVTEAEKILQKHEESQRTKCGHALQKLVSIYERCSSPGWDARDAEAVSLVGYRSAMLFLLILPEHFSCPVPGVCANGQITLEWRQRDGRLLSLAFDDQGFVNFVVFLKDGAELCGVQTVFLGYDDTITNFLQNVSQ